MTRRARRLAIGEGSESERIGARKALHHASEQGARWRLRARKWVDAAHRVLATGPGDGEANFCDKFAGRGWYAAELVRLDSITRQAIEIGDAEAAAVAGGDFGAMVTEAELKFAHEAAWQTGQKILDRPDKGGRRSDDVRNLKLARRFLERRAREGRKSNTRLKVEIGEEVGL